MSMGLRSIAAGALLCSALVGCGEPQCPSGYEKKGNTCYRRRDAGVPDTGDAGREASQGGADLAGDEMGPETDRDNATTSPGSANRDGGDVTQEPDAGAGVAPTADAGGQRSDASDQEVDAGDTTSADGAAPCTPSAEVCDGKDNDCDGRIDEERPSWYCDNDKDGFAPNVTGKVDSCEKPAASAACSDWTTTAPSGANAQDCDDTTALRFPGAGFGLAASSSGDLNCDDQTEIRLEFAATNVPGDYYSSTTPFNICEGTLADMGTAGPECNCWFSTAVGRGFVGFVNGVTVFEESGTGVPYFMRTFPCSKQPGDVIFLQRATRIGGECQLEDGNVAVRQLCR